MKNNNSEKKYWMTIHWPKYHHEDKEEVSNKIWLQEKYLLKKNDLNEGDIVYIYETKTGPTIVTKDEDGEKVVYKCRRGRQGIIGKGIVKNIHKDNNKKYEQCIKGELKCWIEIVELDKSIKRIYLSREDVCEALGYKLGYYFRGYGNKSCLQRLKCEQWKNLNEKIKMN